MEPSPKLMLQKPSAFFYLTLIGQWRSETYCKFHTHVPLRSNMAWNKCYDKNAYQSVRTGNDFIFSNRSIAFGFSFLW